MFKDFMKAEYAGIMISFGCVVYLSLDNSVLGAFLFSLGLLTILCEDLNLFTGKVGYLLTEKNIDFGKILFILFGNIVGCILMAMLTFCIKYKYVKYLESIVISKLNTPIISVFILSIMCGISMFLAVDMFRRKGNFVYPIMFVMAFILCGFEHCIANTYYFVLYMFSTGFSIKCILYLIIMIFGNCFGSYIIAGNTLRG